jgi:hypothetical protein
LDISAIGISISILSALKVAVQPFPQLQARAQQT